MRRITFVTWSQALGDALLLVPALRALRSGYPEATIRLVARSDAAGLLKDAGIIDEVHDNGDLRLAQLAGGSIPIEKSANLRDALGQPDIVLALSSRREAMRVALDALNIRSILAGAVPPVGRHAAQNALELVRGLGVDASWSGAGATAPLPGPNRSTWPQARSPFTQVLEGHGSARPRNYSERSLMNCVIGMFR